jgi:hypothetical protein
MALQVNLANVRRCLREFDFRTLFVRELGWDNYPSQLPVAVNGTTYMLRGVAEKRSFQVFECPAPAGQGVPDYATRGKIEHQVTRSAREHILIYTDAARNVQKWQWVRRELGRPLARREYDYFKGQTGELLVQKLQYLAVDLEDEEGLTLVDVTRRTRQAFDVDRVTRRFYDRFKAEHATFLRFIKGITAAADAEWYASLMLNRLMFVYFIQKKGFLDGDLDYLRNRLQTLRTKKGKDKFLTFYRHFLMRLFHEGLGKPPPRKKDLDALLGEVPYLNGGLFDVHELERAYPDIQVPDEAFERLFNFFDEYRWHLDERPLRDDHEINPDVLGYIFEKYINQKQMGAYYTKEDITDYIARNTLLPFLLDRAARECDAFRLGGTVWQLLREDPDRYIHAAVRHSADVPLPPEVEAGVADVAGRDGWNRPAGPEHALPTETWREHVARRRRCHDLRARLKAGEIRDPNDLITNNLDLAQFAEDALENTAAPDVTRAFYDALERVSVLDPTCGSGAFLFAALNLLEPLYEACLDRMQGFLEDAERSAGSRTAAEFDDFRRTLQEAARHPNRRYFILKSIIVNNLYGVDIMKEAVEICKLRLFLKLVAQVDQVKQLEPLPDIDFNIRPGNTLVGFASLQEVKAMLSGRLAFAEESDEIEQIVQEAERVEEEFRLFKRLQTDFDKTAFDCSEAKSGLKRRLTSLRDKLDRYLAAEYGVDTKKAKEFAGWRDSHQPFHWLVEFYGIMSGGGFDVIIGNPPWKEYAAVRRTYQVRGYSSESCGNLHCLCSERSLNIRSSTGRMSFIVQLPMLSSSRMVAIRDRLLQRSGVLHVLPFDDRPGKLFDGLEHCRAVIYLSHAQSPGENGPQTIYTSRYQRWATEVREYLFAQIEFAQLRGQPLISGILPKYASGVQEHLFRRLTAQTTRQLAAFVTPTDTSSLIFYQEATGYWVKATYGVPYYAKNGVAGAPAHGRFLYFRGADTAHAACAVLNSSLFYAYFVSYGDCFHLSDGLATRFPVSDAILADKTLVELNQRLMKDLRAKAERRTINTRAGERITYDEYYASLSKPIIDEIDRVLAKHYGFTGEELDFIINYDIKYRMGQDVDDEENPE